MKNGHDWKEKVQELLSQFQDEVKKTTQIGMNMLSASKTNTSLNKHYEELGELAFNAIKSGELKWEETTIKKLVDDIEACIENLSRIEQKVSEIKKSKSSEENM